MFDHNSLITFSASSLNPGLGQTEIEARTPSSSLRGTAGAPMGHHPGSPRRIFSKMDHSVCNEITNGHPNVMQVF